MLTFGTSAKKCPEKKRVNYSFFPLLLWFVLQVAALKASYKRCFFFQWKFWCRSSTIKLSLSFSSQLKTPNSLSPKQKTKKSREKGREFQSFISGVVDSPNPETPMFRSSEWYHLWRILFPKMFFGDKFCKRMNLTSWKNYSVLFLGGGAPQQHTGFCLVENLEGEVTFLCFKRTPLVCKAKNTTPKKNGGEIHIELK